MDARLGGRCLAALGMVAGLAAVPAVAGAQTLDAAAVVDAPPVAKALGSAVLVTLVGASFLYRYGAFVDGAVDDTMERPGVAVVYGILAYVLVLFFGFYALNILTSVGVAGTPLSYVALAILAGGALGVSGLGYLVVGTLLTDLWAGRRPWHGLAVGGVLSGVAWLVLPLLPAAAVWVFVAAVGAGGPMRTWVHSERAVEAEL